MIPESGNSSAEALCRSHLEQTLYSSGALCLSGKQAADLWSLRLFLKKKTLQTSLLTAAACGSQINAHSGFWSCIATWVPAAGEPETQWNMDSWGPGIVLHQPPAGNARYRGFSLSPRLVALRNERCSTGHEPAKTNRLVTAASRLINRTALGCVFTSKARALI